MAKSVLTLGFMAVGAAAVTLLIIGHPHPQAQENRATPDVAKLAAVVSRPATGNAAAPPPSPPADWTVPNVDTLPDDDWGRTVRYGRDLITKT
jgi:cytochrome c